jgi:hypothetical protein
MGLYLVDLIDPLYSWDPYGEHQFKYREHGELHTWGFQGWFLLRGSAYWGST